MGAIRTCRSRRIMPEIILRIWIDIDDEDDPMDVAMAESMESGTFHPVPATMASIKALEKPATVRRPQFFLVTRFSLPLSLSLSLWGKTVLFLVLNLRCCVRVYAAGFPRFSLSGKTFLVLNPRCCVRVYASEFVLVTVVLSGTQTIYPNTFGNCSSLEWQQRRKSSKSEKKHSLDDSSHGSISVNRNKKNRKGMMIEGYPFEGLSIAVHETCIILPTLNLAFHNGRCPTRAISQQFLFISHGHMDHIGYIIYSVKHKLKQEYIGLPGTEFKNLKSTGAEVTNSTTMPEIAFTGDIVSDFIIDENNVDVLRAKVLILKVDRGYGAY
ncbi:uncharacterized protein LOC130766583 [Actinidia eriantha]|uniref:uncharacterized protein LOC130766583 n=1 Tax=Actinidia eriantha TaxID=165200 RepID=UPI00258BEB7B|nr:uncharacterized protein LOC130766583 [Actinidia eriantha]